GGSLPKLKASGTVTIAGEEFAVTGFTWMDHEYGYFGTAAKPVKWILQDAQLDNGWNLSNFSLTAPKAGEPMSSFATLQDPNGAMHFALIAFLTPSGDPADQWPSPDTGLTYFTKYRIQIPFYGADLTVTSLVAGQEFPNGPGKGVYEGVAIASGTFLGQPASGTAWNEQAL
ncbi:MAG TPA: lipocalin family protein, partial [Xanthobacteraceae bacterium]|nr:lipocalin family protein [Xanthobacteraceae bacterium]